jgi:hypothetical protein
LFLYQSSCFSGNQSFTNAFAISFTCNKKNMQLKWTHYEIKKLLGIYLNEYFYKNGNYEVAHCQKKRMENHFEE